MSPPLHLQRDTVCNIPTTQRVTSPILWPAWVCQTEGGLSAGNWEDKNKEIIIYLIGMFNFVCFVELKSSRSAHSIAELWQVE